jgi:hypothetical protein
MSSLIIFDGAKVVIVQNRISQIWLQMNYENEEI